MSPDTSVTPNDQVNRLCTELALKVIEYGRLVNERAKADSTYKAARARRILKARLEDGVRAISEAELHADGDPAIESLRLAYLIADGTADACQKAIAALRERIGYGRSLMATEREQDRLHTQVGAHA